MSVESDVRDILLRFREEVWLSPSQPVATCYEDQAIQGADAVEVSRLVRRVLARIMEPEEGERVHQLGAAWMSELPLYTWHRQSSAVGAGIETVAAGDDVLLRFRLVEAQTSTELLEKLAAMMFGAVIC